MTIDREIEARQRDLGSGFVVRRLLPSAVQRMVGPFIFVDHMGPVEFGKGAGLDVRPHPHINLATVTYLFEGEIFHRDSLGSEQPIRPGAVNWMTAGSGIVHSERSTQKDRESGSKLHGMQLWVALPNEHEEAAPSFHHHTADTIPEVEQKGARLRIIEGTAYGAKAPAETLSPLFYVEARLERGAELELPDFAQRATYVVEGAIETDGKAFGEATMQVHHAGAARIKAVEPTRVMILGGEPVGQRYIFWNFVSSSQDRIERAKADWKEQRFAKVPGDDKEFIPLPE